MGIIRSGYIFIATKKSKPLADIPDSFRNLYKKYVLIIINISMLIDKNIFIDLYFNLKFKNMPNGK